MADAPDQEEEQYDVAVPDFLGDDADDEEPRRGSRDLRKAEDSNAQEDEVSALQAQVHDLEIKLREKDQQVDLLGIKVSEYVQAKEQEMEDHNELVDTLRGRISKMEDDMKAKIEEGSKYSAEAEELQSMLQDREDEVAALRKELANQQDLLVSGDDDEKARAAHEQIQRMREENEQLRSELAEAKKHAGEAALSSGGKSQPTGRESVLRERDGAIQELRLKIQDLEAEQEEHESEKKLLQEQLRSAEDQLDERTREVFSLRKKLEMPTEDLGKDGKDDLDDIMDKYAEKPVDTVKDKEHEAELLRLQAELEEAKTALSVSHDQLAAAHTELREANKRAEEYSGRMMAVKQEVMVKDDTIENLNDTLRTLQRENEVKSSDIAEFVERERTLKDELQRRHRVLEELRRHVESTEGGSDVVEQANSAAAQADAEELAKVERELSEALAREKTLRDALRRAEENANARERKVNEYRSALTEKSREMEQYRDRNEIVVRSLQNDAQMREREAKVLRERLAALKEHRAEGTVEMEAAELRDRVNALESDNEGLTKQVENLMRLVRKKESELAEAWRREEELGIERVKAAPVVDRSEEVADLRQRLQRLQETLRAAKDELDARDAQLADVKSQLAAHQIASGEGEDRRNRILEELKGKDDEILELRKRLRDASDQLVDSLSSAGSDGSRLAESTKKRQRELQRDLERREADLTGLKRRMRNLEQERDERAARAEVLADRLRELDAQMRRQRTSEVVDSKRREELSKATPDELLREIATVSACLESAERDIETRDEVVDDLHEQLKSAEQLVVDVRGEIEDMKKQIARSESSRRAEVEQVLEFLDNLIEGATDLAVVGKETGHGVDVLEQKLAVMRVHLDVKDEALAHVQGDMESTRDDLRELARLYQKSEERRLYLGERFLEVVDLIQGHEAELLRRADAAEEARRLAQRIEDEMDQLGRGEIVERARKAEAGLEASTELLQRREREIELLKTKLRGVLQRVRQNEETMESYEQQFRNLVERAKVVAMESVRKDARMEEIAKRKQDGDVSRNVFREKLQVAAARLRTIAERLHGARQQPDAVNDASDAPARQESVQTQDTANPRAPFRVNDVLAMLDAPAKADARKPAEISAWR